MGMDLEAPALDGFIGSVGAIGQLRPSTDGSSARW